MHKFFKALLEIIKLYFLLFIIVFNCYLLFSNLDPLELNLILMGLITIGIFIDKRFNWKPKSIIIIVLLIQIYIFCYLDVIPILLIKDIFWYAVVLNLSFIWHVLILHWLFEISMYYKWDYGCFLFSRLSLITSLTGLYWLVMSLKHSIHDISYFYTFTKKKLGWWEKVFSYIMLSDIFVYILEVIGYVIMYFIDSFTNYCLVFLGKSNISSIFRSLDKLINLYFFMVFTIMLALLLMSPRIYIVWLWFVILKLYKVIKIYIKYWNKYKPSFYDSPCSNLFWDEFRPINKFFYGDHFSNRLLDIYNKEFFLEYQIYLDFMLFFHWGMDWYSINVFDICEVFIYSKKNNRRYRIIALHLFTYFGDSGGPSEELIDYYEKEYKLEALDSIDFLPYLKENDFPFKDFDWEYGNLWEYLSLEEGHYTPSISDK